MSEKKVWYPYLAGGYDERGTPLFGLADTPEEARRLSDEAARRHLQEVYEWLTGETVDWAAYEASMNHKEGEG